MESENRITMESIDRNGLIINEKYEICKRIGSGSFGVLYEGLDVITGNKVALKAINKKRNDKTSILREIKIYRKYLKNNQNLSGIPALYWFGSDSQLGEIMVMDLLGPDLEKVFQLCGKTFSMKTVIMLAIQMLERLQTVHSLRIIHRDLKPENFLLGVDSHSNSIYIIDFGLSKTYMDPISGKHIEFSTSVGMTGTARYCSINSNSGHEQSRRDDLESVAYILSYFYNGSLPWQGLRVKNSQKTRAILCVKQSTNEDKLFDKMDPQLKDYLLYCKQLEFKETPDYQLWIDRFRELYERLGYEWDDRYDWNLFYDKLDLK